MATLTLDNRSVILEDVPPKVAKALSKATSYLQAGYMHVPGFQAKYWDGRRRLVTMLKDGRLKAPAGLAQEVTEVLEARGVEVELVDNRKIPTHRLPIVGWNPKKKLRPYQEEAVRLVTTPRGSLGLVGRGILKLPPRSGKTVIAAAIIRELRVRTLFIVPSKSLLYQARDELAKCLGLDVGIVGDQVWQPGEVTVATIQTLQKRRGKNTKKEPAAAEYLDLLRQADLVFFDECHHLEAEKWRKVMQDSGAAYKVGLSATAFIDHDSEVELGVIWLRACTGEILLDMSVSDLIEQGYLVETEVRMYPVRQPDLGKRGWSQRLQRDAILCNDYRNQLVVDITRELVQDGMRVVIVAGKLEQVGAVTRLLSQTQIKFARLVGQTSQATRDRDIKRFQAGQLRVLVGTVLDEGIDIPECDAIVNAEGGADIKATYQRLRNLTPCNGKTKAVCVDFMDLTHPYFADHSLKRLGVYRGERAFRVTVVQ